MQSALNTETVLDVRRELEAIIESAPGDEYEEVVSQTRAAISSLDDALRQPDDAEAALSEAAAYVVELKHKLRDGPFFSYAQRADEMLSSLTE